MNNMINKIGYMQGRLSPIVDGKIQAFPTLNWQQEFPLAQELGLSLIEWTIDYEDFDINPFVTLEGQNKIKELLKQYNIGVESLTGDCLMQKPFFKESKSSSELKLINLLKKLIESCDLLKVKYIVFPLVDNSQLVSKEQADRLHAGLLTLEGLLKDTGVKIIFESDFGPQKLLNFINDYHSDLYGINYDSGNSAALGYNPYDEIPLYAHRIDNVHIKDRIYQGTTVPLGSGNTDFEALFSCLRKANYAKNYILQTARAEEGQHQAALKKYKNFVEGFLK
ncbi:hypothetical protein BVY03_03330 [bacterium K02(2017)]|nr:hypothetical protein BVY03_03330 [bacterium K02(2017)]